MSNAQTLYKTLFETLSDLKNGKVTIEQAKARSEVAQTIINVAKVEVDYAKVTNSNKQSQFFNGQLAEIPAQEEQPSEEKQPQTQVQIGNDEPMTYQVGTGVVHRSGNVTRHTMK